MGKWEPFSIGWGLGENFLRKQLAELKGLEMPVVCVLAYHPVFLLPKESANVSQRSFLEAADYCSSLTDKSLRAETISKSQSLNPLPN